MTDRTHTRLAPRRTGARVGAVDEYTALQRAAMDRLVQHGIDAASATATHPRPTLWPSSATGAASTR